MKKWARWQDWVAVVAGLYAAVATSWMTDTTASMTLMLVFGILMIVAGLISVAMPRFVSMEWAVVIASALLFISPWMGSYAHMSQAAWTSWICGAIGVVAGLWALAPAMEMRRDGGTRMAH